MVNDMSQDFNTRATLIILLEIWFVRCQSPDGETTTSLPEEVTTKKGNSVRDWFDPELFSRLTLPRRELFGSRWIIENKQQIDVYHAIEVVDATLIHTNELTLRIEFNLRQTWNATGLEFPEGLFKESDPPGQFVTADYNVLRYMWSPDSYISTSRESNMNTVGMPLSLVYIFKNMSIIYKVRMFTKVACSSSFQWYPLDIQTCHFVVESYKYHDNIVRYHWTPDHRYRPVVVHVKRLFQYELRQPLRFDSGIFERGGRGKMFSYVRLKFTFERKLGNNIIQVYTPTTLVVVLSWFSFWLGLDAIPGRISLLVTCMLTLVTMHSGIKSTIPPVHYITMMDVWLVCCMAFVFTAVCEFVVVKYLHWRLQQRDKILDKRRLDENRETFYRIMQQMGLASAGFDEFRMEDRGSSGLSEKIRQGELPYASEKQSLYWNAPTKIVPVEILQSVVVDAVTGDQLSRNHGQEKLDEGTHIRIEGNDRNLPQEGESSVKENEEETKKRLPLWVKLDRFCRYFMPSLFCLFNLIYWPVLYCGSTEQDNEMYN